MAFLRKRVNTNPNRGPFHFRAPGRIFWRIVRGMIPHKTAKGQDALNRLKVTGLAVAGWGVCKGALGGGERAVDPPPHTWPPGL